MTKILSSESSKYVGRPGFKKLGDVVSKHSAEAKRFVTSKTSVRRLIARDPSRAITQNEKVDQFTDNPNPKYQPTGIGAQSVSRSVAAKPKPPSTSGHQKVIKRPATRWKRGRLS